jgi:hypothetical protein
MGRVVPVVCGHDVAPRVCQWLKRNAGNFTPLHALQGGAVPVSEMFGTFALSVGAAVRGGPWQLSSISNFFSFPDAKLG